MAYAEQETLPLQSREPLTPVDSNGCLGFLLNHEIINYIFDKLEKYQLHHSSPTLRTAIKHLPNPELGVIHIYPNPEDKSDPIVIDSLENFDPAIIKTLFTESDRYQVELYNGEEMVWTELCSGDI